MFVHVKYIPLEISVLYFEKETVIWYKKMKKKVNFFHPQ